MADKSVPSDSPPLLSAAEIQLFYQIIEQSHQADSIDKINKIIRNSLRKLMPHTMAAYGIGELPSRKIIHSVNMDFPQNYFDEVVNQHNLLSSPVFKQWVESLKPVIVIRDALPKTFPANWQQSFIKNNINHVLVHGLLDVTGKTTSYFSFGNFSQVPGNREAHICELLIPHLHVAITNVLDSQKTPESANILSKRETEIIKWVYEGKTNSQIGDLLSISAFTVKNHIKNILDKLNASNRTHAVAKAIHCGIIEAI